MIGLETLKKSTDQQGPVSNIQVITTGAVLRVIQCKENGDI